MDYLKAIKEKEDYFSSLHGRMDADRDLVNLSAYTMKDSDNRKISDIINVTLNRPAVFAANVESALGNAVEQPVVSTDKSGFDTAYVEEVVKAGFRSANNRLIRSGRFSLNAFIDQQMCRRGRSAARCLFYMNEDELVTDITPWDSRFVTYDIDANGLKWAAYKTKRTKGDIESQSWAIDKGFELTSKEAEIVDVWDREHNEIHVGGNLEYEQPNPWGFTPVCLQIVPLGSMLADEGNIQYEGESIFFLIRGLIPELNRIVSILQTLNLLSVKPPMGWASKDGQQPPPEYQVAVSAGAMTQHETGGGFTKVDYGDARRAATLILGQIDKAIQQGSLSSIDLGTLEFELSAVALIEIGEGRDQVFLPRLGSRGLLKQQLAEMMVAQIINCGQSNVEIGLPGHKQSYKVSKLDGEYNIEFKYFMKSPELDAARFALANSTGTLIPEYAKRRDILKREDPEHDERMLRWEEAERISPRIKIYRTIKSLLEEAERGNEDAEFEAELLAAEMDMSLESLMAGDIDQIPKSEEQPKPNQMINLFGRGGSSARKAGELQRTPRAEE